jgi:hypothetical protein
MAMSLSTTDKLITSGQLFDLVEPVTRQTLVANQMTEYLERDQKTLNESILNEMLAAFKRLIMRQIMSPRMDRTGYESTTSYTQPCPRKSRLQYDGVKGEPVQARSMLKFLLGDLVEMAIVAIIQLAGRTLVDNNRDLFITGKDGVKVNVHPDGRVVDVFLDNPELSRHYNFECKSCDSHTFDKWLEQGGPDDSWGYLTQCSIEIQAWREAGYDVNSTCFVAVSTGSRQGSIAEWIIPYDQKLVDGWHARRQQARGERIPEIPFELAEETEYQSGKAIDANAWAFGEAKPRVNAKGAVYGWDVPTGRKILPMICSYCAYKGECHPGAVMEVKSGRPVWVVATSSEARSQA